MLAVTGATAAVALVVRTMPAQSWWPGWAAVGAWWGIWWPLVTIVAVVIAAALMRRWSRHADPVTPSPPGARQLGNVGWRRARSTASATNADGGSPAGKIAAVVTAFTALAALVFTAQSLTATRNQVSVSEQSQFTERYSTAVDQISTPGLDHLETRLGGIYALERLANDSSRDQPTIIEVLSAFVRSNAPLPTGNNQSCTTVSLDVQAALTVLGSLNPAFNANASVDFNNTCLANANLEGADLVHADFEGANLTDADLQDANLDDSELDGADNVKRKSRCSQPGQLEARRQLE